jgi:PAS domain S-box-containing protein
MNKNNKPRTIIVNDEKLQLRLISAILEKDGWIAIPCDSAELALKKMEEDGSPDVIITDLHMPNIDGWRFCRLLRSPEYKFLNKVPILVMSATFSGSDPQRMTIELGANAFLSVPFEASVLKAHMQALLRGETPKIPSKVFIIEKDKELAQIIQDTFTSYGFVTYKAHTIEKARDLFKNFKPDIAIIDYHLPDGYGSDLLESFKLPNSSSIAIMTTMDPTPSLALQFLRNGADAYVRKPYDTQYLIDLCEKASRERALLRIEDLLEERTTKLRESEEKFRKLFEESRDAIYISSIEGVMIDVNQAALNLFGYSRDEMVGMNTLNLYANPENRKKFQKDIQEKEAVKNYEVKLLRKDNQEIDCLLTSSLRTNKDGSIIGYQGIIRDITDRKKMEKELLKTEKLESISILAGGIAHDYNNILTAIIGNISLAKLYIDPKDQIYDKLLEAEKASIRAKDLTYKLLTFSKGGDPIKKIVSITNLLEQSSNFAPIDPKIVCKLSIPEDLWLVNIDESQISQVINNIIINADQAMPSGGTIFITAENTVIEDNSISPLNSGKYIKITIKDEGIGIPEDHLLKIFDPYYTTKQKGRGLGLAAAYSIVKTHNGHILVDSNIGEGTIFYIFLPAAEIVNPKELLTFAKTKKMTGRILIMDDEEAIREITEGMLKFMGFTVTKTKDGQETIDIYRTAVQSGEGFDLVITDLTIPGGMGGVETIKKLLEIDPEVRAIVSSGYSNDKIMSNYKDYGFKAVICKPYKIQDLNEALIKVFKEE